MDIRTLVEDFSTRLATMIEQSVLERARVAIDSALATNGTAGRGKRRKKVPIQLCPVPGCKNPAAPVFGMVCAEHKGLPKAKIKKYREARRAKKLKAAA